MGEVVTPVQEINEEVLNSPLQPVVRVATAADVQHNADNKAAEKEAFALCQKKIAEHRLDMKLVSVEYTFDNSKILFYFTANGRVDFRSLVKDLASVFRTRIELRQIGVRDEAKMIGGLGPCGRPICCAAFLGDFQPVSIKMAKEQNLSLNPIKISGVCGRLMCCLKYEEDTYEETRRRLPRVGKDVITPDGTGVVTDVNVIRETVRVRIQKGDSFEFKDYPAADVQRPGFVAAPAMPNDGDATDLTADAAPGTDAVGTDTPAPKPARPPHQKQESRPRGNERRAAQPAPGTDVAPVQTAVTAEPVKNAEPASAPSRPAAGSSWQEALARAMKAAGSDDARKDAAPAGNEDHQEPEMTSTDPGADEIL